jgi:hypothetical protein
MYQNEAQSSSPISSPALSTTTTNERMSIAWLLANDDDYNGISSDADDYQTTSSPY